MKIYNFCFTGGYNMRKIVALFMSCLICFFVCSCDKADIKNLSDEKVEENLIFTNLGNRLPEIFCSNDDANTYYSDMVGLKNGGFVVVGDKNTDTLAKSFVRLYDDQMNLVAENSDYGIGMGFDKVSACDDGGIIVATSSTPYIMKLNNKLEKEWISNYGIVESSAVLHDIVQVSTDCYAVLFDSVLSSKPGSRSLKIAFLSNTGETLGDEEILFDTQNVNANIIADGKGGLYITAACDELVAQKYDLVAKVYDDTKNLEAAVMHFSKDRELDWVTTLGGNGDDWCEGGTVDSEGNIYVAVCTHSPESDSFWDMEADVLEPCRYMLVKLNNDGEIVYKHMLSNKGTIPKRINEDRIFKMGMYEDAVYVVGISNYFDGIQDKYECEQFSSSESDDNVFCVYTAAIDKSGKEIGRGIFRCDANIFASSMSYGIIAKYGATILQNGNIVICGSVSKDENSFDISFETNETQKAALYVYK